MARLYVHRTEVYRLEREQKNMPPGGGVAGRRMVLSIRSDGSILRKYVAKFNKTTELGNTVSHTVSGTWKIYLYGKAGKQLHPTPEAARDAYIAKGFTVVQP